MTLYDERRPKTAGAEAIKVTDRRRFTASGEVRPDAPKRQEAPRNEPAHAQVPERAAPQPPQAQQPLAPTEPASQQQTDDEPASGVDFLSFVASLATNAMAALGMLPEHERQGLPKSPEMAREYIEIIAMLEHRTRGNLSAQEAQAIKRLLGDLRLGYVEATRSVKPAHMPPEMMGALRGG